MSRFALTQYETDTYNHYDDIRTRARSEAVPCPNCAALVHPSNWQKHMELYHANLLTADEQMTVYEIVKKTAPNGIVNRAHIKSLVTVLTEILQTGALDGGDGEQIPFRAARLDHLKAVVTEETYERIQRHELKIADHFERKALRHASAE